MKIRRWTTYILVPLLALMVGGLGGARPAAAASLVPISGSGSTWSYNALHAWTGNVAQYGMVVNYSPVGSTTGRSNFKQGTVDFAASDIPYGVKDGVSDDPPPTASQRGFAYMPVTAGGTVFMYNLKINGNRVTNLRLSGPVIAGIFTGTITRWNDPKIAADNPGLRLPALKVIPVVRSDGSGSTAQFTQWMVATQGAAWTAYCAKVGRDPCTQTSAYPVVSGSGMVAQAGDANVAGYVAQEAALGTIGYVEYSYAVEAGFPVAKVLNVAGYYTEPTPGHVAVALLQAKINMDSSDLSVYLTQDLHDVYTDPDPRTYELSSYSYIVLPTSTNYGFNANKGFTLGEFGKYVLCQGQTVVDALGYSALPINLVLAGYQQLAHIPGASVPPTNVEIVRSCNNPTFSTDGTNTLARNDPQPAACDKKGPTQCTTGTGGAHTSTPVVPSAQGGGNNGIPGTGTTGGSSASPGGNGGSPNTVCDPDTGTCVVEGTGDQSNGAAGPIVAVPVDTSPGFGDGFGVVLMVLAAVLLIGLGVVPPLIALSANKRRSRDRIGGL